MTQEALKLALDWFKCYADKSMSRNNADALADEVVDAIEEALAQPEQEPQVCCGEYDTCLRACTPRGRHLAQPAERNFCSRCGKRTADLTTIHTCTPSQGEHMTKDAALKLALEALENISTALREDDVLGSDSELMLNAITAIEEALDECDEDELIIRYHEMTIKRLEKRIEELTAQPEQESTNWHVIDPTGNVVATEKDAIHGWARLGGFKPTLEVLLAHHESGWRVVPAPPLPVQERNFCPRCGKRTADLTTIHTCTPPVAADS
jgi:hypothetical protein